MSRRTVVTLLVGAVLAGGAGAPALANPVSTEDDQTVVCLRTDSQSGKRDGVCVWVPAGR